MRTLGGLALVCCACGSEPRTGELAQVLSVGAERELEPAVTGPAADHQSLQSVVFDGTNFMAIWRDGRRRFGPQPGWPDDVYRARFSPNGTLVDPIAQPIWEWSPFTRDELEHIAAACDGAGGCLVVSSATPDGGGQTRDLRAQRLANGVVVDASPFLIAGGDADQEFPTVAWDGGAYRVMYRDNDAAPDQMSSRRVLPDGTVGPPVVVSPAGYFGQHVACGPASCLLLFRTATFDVSARMIDAAGTVGEEFTVAAAASYQEPLGAVWAGTQYWTLWRDSRNTNEYSDGEIYGARISPTGTVLDPSGIPITAGIRAIDHGVLGFDGTDAIAVWREHPVDGGTSSSRLARLAATGTVRDPGGVAYDSNGSFGGALACGAGNCFLAWSEGDIFGIRFSGTTRLDPTPRLLSNAANAQVDPMVVGRGGSYTAVWEDSRDGGTIRGARFTAGVAPTTSFAAGPPGSSFESQHEPALAVGPTAGMIAWTEHWPNVQSEIRARMLDAAGQPTGTVFTAAGGTGSQQQPALGAGADGFLLAWIGGCDATTGGLCVRAFDAAGTPRGLPLHVASDLGRYGARVGFDGTNYVLVWDQDEPGTTYTDVYAQRISPLGAKVDAAPIAISTEPMMHEEHARVTCGGGSCLVSWRTWTSAIHGVRLAADGTILDATPRVLSRANRPAYEHAVAFDGTWFVVAWTEGLYTPFLRRFAADGTAEPGEPLAIHDTPVEFVSVAGDGLGNAVVLYDRIDDDPAVHGWRVKAREVGDAVPAPPDAGPDGGGGGGTDGGVPGTDAGGNPVDPAGSPGGCCRTSGPSDAFVALFVLGMLVARRRRRG